MANISKSTPYVRYREKFTSNVHLGTIHVESEYLDNTRPTTIESIHGMTWHNRIYNENKELPVLSDRNILLNTKQREYFDTGEKRVPIDEIHGLEDCVANSDGTYTYKVETVEGDYAETYDGINHITSSSNGLSGEVEITYNTNEEDITGSLVFDMVNGGNVTIENSKQGELTGAILKGQTLVNIDSYYDRNDFYIYGADSIDKDGYIQLTAKGIWVNAHTRNNSLVKPNTKYAIIVDIKENTLNSSMSNVLKICTNTDTLESVWSDGYGIDIAGGVTGRLFFTATTSNNVSSAKMLQRAYIGSALKTGHIKYRWMIIEYQKGMENWDIPYFRGMTSVKMPVLTTTGKNLVDYKNYNLKVNEWENPKEIIIDQQGLSFNVDTAGWKSLWYDLYVKSGEQYTLSYNTNLLKCYIFKSKVSTYVSSEFVVSATTTNEAENKIQKITKTFTAPSTGFIRIHLASERKTGNHILQNFQIEKGSTATPYEPYKSNILSTPSDLELGRIGDVKDELNLLTGELVERTEELELNVTDVKFDGVNKNGLDRFIVVSSTIPKSEQSIDGNAISNNGISAYPNFNYGRDNTFSYSNSTKRFYFTFTKDTTTSEELLNKLTTDKMVIRFKRDVPVTKTLDLSIVDQNGKSQPALATYPSVTHIHASSDTLTPSGQVDFKVASSIETVTGIDFTIENGEHSDLISGMLYGDTLLNVLPSPSLKNSMGYNTSTQKLNKGYENINVVDGEFKEAILSGNTLVNLGQPQTGLGNNGYSYQGSSGGITNKNGFIHYAVLNSNTCPFIRLYSNSTKKFFTTQSLETSTKYMVVVKIDVSTTNTLSLIISPTGYTTANKLGSTSLSQGMQFAKIIFDTPSSFDSNISLGTSTYSTSGDYVDIYWYQLFEYQDGMENWDIPYFEGMQSVKMPVLTTVGKNLFDGKIEKSSIDMTTGSITPNVASSWSATNYINVKNINSLYFQTSQLSNMNVVYMCFDENKNFIGHKGFYNSLTGIITPLNNTHYIRLRLPSDIDVSTTQIEQGTQPTSYEPYKSNILSCLEPVELGKVGDVEDTLDLLTGEVIESTIEINPKSTNNWGVSDLSTSEHILIFTNDFSSSIVGGGETEIKSNIFPQIKHLGEAGYPLQKGINVIGDYSLRICFPKTEIADLNAFKLWLDGVDLKVRCISKEKVHKTVDLSIVNQDNQPQTDLHSIANGYINTSSQGLLPKVDYEVPTSNSYNHCLDMVKPNTLYTIKSSSDCNATIDGTSYPLSANGTFTTPSTITDNVMVLDTPVEDLMFIEGDLTDRELDYFTGLQSVGTPILKTVGKNLFDMSNCYPSPYGYRQDKGTIEKISDTEYKLIPQQNAVDFTISIGQKIKLKKGFAYTLSFDYGESNQSTIDYFNVHYSNGDTKRIAEAKGGIQKTITFTPIEDVDYVWLANTYNSYNSCYIKNIQIEEGSEATPYVLHQSNALTLEDEVKLCRIGDTRDKLDFVEEKLYKRIGEFVLDGTENWEVNSTGTDTTRFVTYDKLDNLYNFGAVTNMFGYFICDTLAPTESNSETDTESIQIYSNPDAISNLKIRILKNKVSTVDELKAYLSTNPITVQYLALETVEDVKLVKPNYRTSTASITLSSQLNHNETGADRVLWNPYQGHYVRYNIDGTIEPLSITDRQYVELYDKHTYVVQDYNNLVKSHDSKGTNYYCLLEPNKEFEVIATFTELPNGDIKVNLGGATGTMELNNNVGRATITTPSVLENQMCSISSNGFKGTVTNVMVIKHLGLEVEDKLDIDYFSGINGIGEIKKVDGVNKASIIVEQTNGNLIDGEFTLFNNGNYIAYDYFNSKNIYKIKPNKDYIIKLENGKKVGDTKLAIRNNGKDIYVISSPKSYDSYSEYIFRTPYNAETMHFFAKQEEDGSVHTYYPFELCYADMAKDGIRPRYHSSFEFLLPMQLFRVGSVYDNLYFDEMKGYYRIQQSIGHKYFTGASNESWTTIADNGSTIQFRYNNADIQLKQQGEYLTNLLPVTQTTNYDSCYFNGTSFIVTITKERLPIASVDGFKTWLGANNLHLMYQLSTPIMHELTQYNSRAELRTYKDEIFTFLKNCQNTEFVLNVAIDKTYRFKELEESQGLMNRIANSDERLTSEDTTFVNTISGKGIANLIENPNNVPTILKPNYEGKATSHLLSNSKQSTINIHGFEPNGGTCGVLNSETGMYDLKVMAGDSTYANTNSATLNIPYQLETYEDGSYDKVYYDDTLKQWRITGGTTRAMEFSSTGQFNNPVELFRGMAPRTGLFAEFKVRFTSGTTNAYMYYSLDGVTYKSTILRSMSDDVDYYIGFFNTGGTKIDYGIKYTEDAEYTNLVNISQTIPAALIVNQIQRITECTQMVDKTYFYEPTIMPLQLETYNGNTNIYMDGKGTNTNIIINNIGLHKDCDTIQDETYTVYWKYLGGEGNITVSLRGTTVSADGQQEYVTLKTAVDGLQDVLVVGGYNLSIQDLMLVKGDKINELAYFEGSRQVGTITYDEEGNRYYKISMVSGTDIIRGNFEDSITFEDTKKHNVLVTKLLGETLDKN